MPRWHHLPTQGPAAHFCARAPLPSRLLPCRPSSRRAGHRTAALRRPPLASSISTSSRPCSQQLADRESAHARASALVRLRARTRVPHHVALGPSPPARPSRWAHGACPRASSGALTAPVPRAAAPSGAAPRHGGGALATGPLWPLCIIERFKKCGARPFLGISEWAIMTVYVAWDRTFEDRNFRRN